FRDRRSSEARVSPDDQTGDSGKEDFGGCCRRRILPELGQPTPRRRHLYDLAMSAATMSSHEFGNRVLTAPIRSYAELDPSGTEEHDEWRLRAIGRAESALRPPRSDPRATGAVDALADALLRISVTLADTHGTPDLG